MHAKDDELLHFNNVRVMSSTGSALLCEIGGRMVWLPRRHISGNLWCRGDRGRLLIRRWVARDRSLIEPDMGNGIARIGHPISQRQACPLHVVRRATQLSHAD
jgi:hypothetical protein